MTTTKRFLVGAAARNNAEWCAVMSRSHGVRGEFGRQAWTAPARTPPYYPDAVTLAPGADAAELLDRIDTETPGASVKDSFADLDLTRAGFRVLFDAQWIHRPASAPVTVPEPVWDVVRTPPALRAWQLARAGAADDAALFRPELLDDPATFVLAGRSAEGRVVAGAVASRSERVAGISNVFASAGGAAAAWPGVLHTVERLFPGLPVVGYEHGEDLDAALRHGFEPIGPLRIWLRD
ncbi:hypothetical protein GTY75_16700 [Streptomyces sp. SID8381]|uniref:hypothetical protein n=1 Tax=unclassified Streptomyces TaxID=2593676 RepID=UPI000381518B|nr:hypothetical protein [Streptomyces sp. Amel2xE9]MYX28263.1 hypothetical protein [Streptomyces sp. SID8381]